MNTATGDITFTPEVGFTGPPTPITYTVNDVAGNTSGAATVTLTDMAPPVAVDDMDVFDGTPVTVAVDANDGNGEPLDLASVNIIGSTGAGQSLVVPGEGTWSVNTTTGDITFTPEAGFTGSPTPITYMVNDVAGNTSSAATVTLTDMAPPVAVDDVDVFNGTTVTVAVDANDGNGEPLDPASVNITGSAGAGQPLVVPGEGIWSVNTATGDITFTPEVGFTGPPTPITYTVNDVAGNTSGAATVTLTDMAPPVAVDDMDVFDGTPVTVAVDANDGNGESLDLASVNISGSAGAGQPLAVPGEGTWSVNTTTGDITFTPEAGFTGLPTPITYTVNDLAGNTSSAATVTLTDMAPPVAVDDMDIFDGTTVTIAVDANDGNGEPLDLASVNITGSAGAGQPLAVPGEGTWSVNTATGDITFTPEAGFTGPPTPITYTVNDIAGNTSSAATVTLTDMAPPVAVDDTGIFDGAPVTVAVDANDGNGEPLDLTSVNITGSAGAGQPLAIPGEGTWSVNTTTGDITFTPEIGFTGSPTPITYTVNDVAGNTSSAATVTLTDMAPPVAVDDMDIFDGTTVTIPVDANDGNGEPLDLASVNITGSAGAGQPLAVPGEGTWSVNTATGDITFTPEAGFTGSPTPITYTVNDVAGNTSSAATVTLTDMAPPVAVDDMDVFDGTPVTVAVDANDGNGEPLNLASVNIIGSTGAGQPLVVPGEGTWSVNTATGDITFTPEVGFTGSPTPITYTVNDVAGNTSSAATVTLTDMAPPVAVDDMDVFDGTPVTVAVDANDGNGEPLDLASVNIIGSTGAGQPLVVPGEGTWSVNTTTGDITFTPEAGFTGPPTPITYTVDDVAGNTSSAATVTLTDMAPPVAVDDMDIFDGTTVTIPVDANDGNGEPLDLASVSITGSAGAGQPLAVPGEGTWSVNTATGDITFTPEVGFTGSPTPITYTVNDLAGNTSNAATVTLTDMAPPVAVDDMGIFAGTPVTVAVDANDGNGEPLDLASVNIIGSTGAGQPLVVPGEGTWSVNTTTGDITFTPEAGFIGLPMPITYTINDLAGNTSSAATVTLTDRALPVAVDDTGVFDGNPVTVAVDANDDGEPLDLASVNITGSAGAGQPLAIPGEGTWSVNTATGDITFTPEAGFTGSPTPITYTVNDLVGNTSNAATVTLTDMAAPVAVDDMERL